MVDGPRIAPAKRGYREAGATGALFFPLRLEYTIFSLVPERYRDSRGGRHAIKTKNGIESQLDSEDVSSSTSC